jgi:hypothetical protein
MLMEHASYRNQEYANKWGVHVDLFRCVQNFLEIPHGLWILLSIAKDWKKRVENIAPRKRPLVSWARQ